MHRLLFVCSGNTCRSPLAEALARNAAKALGITDVEISSAGTSAWDGAPPSDGALLIGLERGMDLSGHRARELTAEIVASADLILAMGPHHLEAIEALGGTGKAHLLTAYAARATTGDGVNDPYGGDLEVYRATATELDREVRRVLERFAEERSSPGRS
jgi:protein-tyrosine-phosphatase